MSRRIRFVALLLLLTLVAWLVFRFVMPTQNGKALAQRISDKSAALGMACNWAGFVHHKQSGVLQVFVHCDGANALQGSVISNQDELMQAISKKVVEPLLPASPHEPGYMVTFIVPVKKDAVACLNVAQLQVTTRSYDSFDNYCWPQ